MGRRNGKKVNICINKYAVRVLLIQSIAILILPAINWFDETQSLWGLSAVQCNGDALDLVWHRLVQALLAAHEGTSHSFYVRVSSQVGFAAHTKIYAVTTIY